MVYVFGILGFFLGFACGQVALYHMLRGRSNREITTDSSIKWTYGLFNWALAALGAWVGVSIWNIYLTG